MKANQCARTGTRRPDGGQMLLLSGFLLAGAIIVAIGTYTVLQRTEGQVVRAQHSEMVDLFLNTRGRAVEYFSLVSQFDTNSSLEQHLNGYLIGQHRTARSLSLDLNTSLAGDGSDARAQLQEGARCSGGSCSPSDTYDLEAFDGAESYDCVVYDEFDDGLITDEATGEVYAAILWVRVLGHDGDLEETLVIDVPSTDAGC